MKKRLSRSVLAMLSTGVVLYAGQYAGVTIGVGSSYGYGNAKAVRFQKIRKKSASRMLRRVLRDIRRHTSLTKSQRKRIRTIVMRGKKNMRADMAKLARDRKRSLVRSGNGYFLDFSKFMTTRRFYFEAFVKTMEERRIKMIEWRGKMYRRELRHTAKIMKKIFDVLTPAQRKELLACR